MNETETRVAGMSLVERALRARGPRRNSLRNKHLLAERMALAEAVISGTVTYEQTASALGCTRQAVASFTVATLKAAYTEGWITIAIPAEIG